MLKVYLSSPFFTAESYEDCYIQFISGKVIVSEEVCVDTSTVIQDIGDFLERLHGVM